MEIVFQEQSYSSLHSGLSLAWDHFCGDIDDHCGIIADFCGVINDFCGVIADPCSVIADPCSVIADPWGERRPRGRRCQLLRDSLNIVKHHETLFKTLWNIMNHSYNIVKLLQHRPSMRRQQSSARRHRRSRWVSGDIGDCGVGVTELLIMEITELLIMEIWVLFPNLTAPSLY